MKFIDKAKITIYAGKGGNGISSFYKSRRILRGGPDGGNGGNGGNIFLISSNNIYDLRKFINKKYFFAENGKNGSKNNCTGKDGNDLFIYVPINTIVTNFETNEHIFFFEKNNQSILIARGGKHGLGNSKFKSSINRSPKNFTLGGLGDKFILKLDLEIYSDICVLGISNSGKSSLIKKILNINTMIDSYLYTSVPMLNILNIYNKKLLILDTPPIIINNSKNKEINLRFTKHIKRCNLILYIIDISFVNNNLLYENINLINNKILNLNKNYNYKTIWIIFNKIDLINNFNLIKRKIKHNLKILNFKSKYFFISLKNNINIDILYKNIKVKFINKKNILNNKFNLINKDKLQLNW